MYEIPLFPLNTVLFPGVPILLHIFEDRYKAMINLCIEKRTPFGVVMIEEGRAEFGPAEPVQVGCTAEIVKVDYLEEGRMNIVAVGQDRFRILETNQSQPYLQGQVENYPMLGVGSADKLAKSCDRLAPYIQSYIRVLRQVADVSFEWDELPTDPLELGYLASYILQVPPDQKQHFLTISDPVELLEYLCSTFHTEIALIKSMVKQEKARGETGLDELFSLN